MSGNQANLADGKQSIAAIYEDANIAEKYLAKRLTFSWQRLLHRRQIALLNAAIREYAPVEVLEVAPGPARLSAELQGIKRATMVENSAEMLSIARARLQKFGVDKLWNIQQGDAFKLLDTVQPKSFDLAYTFRLIRHFRTPEREQLYAVLHAALKSGGVLIFDVVNATVHDRVEAKNPVKPSGEIPIYDVSYSPSSFREEMGRCGFDVLKMVPIVKRFGVQSFVSYKLDDVTPRLAESAIRALECLPANGPLEWIVVCRKTDYRA